MLVELIKSTDDLGNITYWIEKDGAMVFESDTDDLKIATYLYKKVLETKPGIEVIMQNKIK